MERMQAVLDRASLTRSMIAEWSLVPEAVPPSARINVAAADTAPVGQAFEAAIRVASVDGKLRVCRLGA